MTEKDNRIILVDIDSTIAKKVSRHHYQWERVGEDAPIPETIELINSYPARTVFLTARAEGYVPTEKLRNKFNKSDEEILLIGRIETEKWLKVYVGPHVMSRDLIMKPANSFENSAKFKLGVIEKLIAEGFEIDFILDDNEEVIRVVNESRLINTLHFTYS